MARDRRSGAPRPCARRLAAGGWGCRQARRTWRRTRDTTSRTRAARYRPDRLEDRVDEWRQCLDRRRQDQDQAEETQKDGERHQPAFAGIAVPETACEIGDRSAGASEHDHPAPHSATFPDHAICSLSDRAGADARLVTSVGPATTASMPQRRNVEYASAARLTMGSPATLNEVLSRTGMPLRRP